MGNRIKEIRSTQNELIRTIVQLREKSRTRKRWSLCLAEGRREVSRAISSGYRLEQLLICPPLLGTPEESLVGLISKGPTAHVPPELYQKIALRGTTEGVLAVLHTPNHSLEDFQPRGECPLILVAESPEKPGNLGALFRTADAAGLDGVLLAETQTDIYSPQCIRSSLGAVFAQRIALGSNLEIRDFLRSQSIRVVCAALSASVPYHEVDFREPTAIVLGAEDKGLSPFWLESSDLNVIIPMKGMVDSLNLSVSAAVLIFEALRQRSLT